MRELALTQSKMHDTCLMTTATDRGPGMRCKHRDGGFTFGNLEMLENTSEVIPSSTDRLSILCSFTTVPDPFPSFP